MGQKVLLVDGAPEREPVAEPVLQLMRLVARYARLDRVEDIQADVDEIVQDGSDGAVAVVHDEDVRVGCAELPEDLGVARPEDASPHVR